MVQGVTTSDAYKAPGGVACPVDSDLAGRPFEG